ncbi:unnamed protein product, partial [Rotaria magnacalcarata]
PYIGQSAASNPPYIGQSSAGDERYYYVHGRVNNQYDAQTGDGPQHGY